MAIIIPKERVPVTAGGQPTAVIIPVVPAAPGGSQSQASAGVQQATNGTAQLTRVGAQATTLQDTSRRPGLSLSAGLAAAGNLQLSTPLGGFQISKSNAQSVNKNKRLPIPLLGLLHRRKQ